MIWLAGAVGAMAAVVLVDVLWPDFIAWVRPVCPACDGHGCIDYLYYGDWESDDCTWCNPDGRNEAAVTRLWRWQAWRREREERRDEARWASMLDEDNR